MGYKGTVKGKVIELEEHLPLPDGTQVEVTVKPLGGRKNSPKAWLQLVGTLTDEEAEAIMNVVRKEIRRIEWELLGGERAMRYMLDTDHFSHLQRDYPPVVRHLQSLPADAEVVTSVVTQAEFLTGVHQATTPQRQAELRSLYEWLMTNISDILPITTEVAEIFAATFVDLRRKGKPIPINDIWIAAIALANDCILVNSDEQSRFIDGLQVEDWTKSEIAEGEGS